MYLTGGLYLGKDMYDEPENVQTLRLEVKCIHMKNRENFYGK